MVTRIASRMNRRNKEGTQARFVIPPVHGGGNCGIAIHVRESTNTRSEELATTRRERTMKSLGALMLIAVASVAAAEPPQELVVGGDGIVSGSVNGVPGRLRIDPAVPTMPILSTAWAQRVGLRPGPFAFGYLVGPETVRGRTAVAHIAIGNGVAAVRHRVGWAERPFTAEADGVVGPGGVP